jgi:hypothetical protein
MQAAYMDSWLSETLIGEKIWWLRIFELGGALAPRKQVSYAASKVTPEHAGTACEEADGLYMWRN